MVNEFTNRVLRGEPLSMDVGDVFLSVGWGDGEVHLAVDHQRQRIWERRIKASRSSMRPTSQNDAIRSAIKQMFEVGNRAKRV